MRYICRRALLAVVWLVALLLVDSGTASHSDISSRDRFRSPWLYSKQELNQMLREEENNNGGNNVLQCCPSVKEMIDPKGGTDRRGMYVQLYREGDIKQTFYELSCAPGVEGRPCLFVDRKLSNLSRCVQQFSYTYAILRDVHGGDTDTDTRHHHNHHSHRNEFPLPPYTSQDPRGWRLDYIRIRSGCSCEVIPKQQKRKRGGGKHSRKYHRGKHIDDVF